MSLRFIYALLVVGVLLMMVMCPLGVYHGEEASSKPQGGSGVPSSDKQDTSFLLQFWRALRLTGGWIGFFAEQCTELISGLVSFWQQRSTSAESQVTMADSMIRSVALGYWPSRVLFLIAKLGVADTLDQFAAVPPKCSQLSAALATPVNRDYFCRLIRAAVALQFLTQYHNGSLAHTPISRLLRQSDANSARSFVLLAGGETALAWFGLEHALQSGGTGWQAMFGDDVWTYLSQPEHRDEHERFHTGMRAVTQREAPALVGSAPWLGSCKHVCDVGGGHGALLAEVLMRYPSIAGTLLDMSDVLGGARKYLHTRGGLDERTTFADADLFALNASQALAPCDCLMMKNVLHDWNDEQAARILLSLSAHLNSAEAERTRTLTVFELVMPSYATALASSSSRASAAHSPPSPLVALMDLNVLAVCGGRERSLDDFAQLFARAGLCARHHSSQTTPPPPQRSQLLIRALVVGRCGEAGTQSATSAANEPAADVQPDRKAAQPEPKNAAAQQTHDEP